MSTAPTADAQSPWDGVWDAQARYHGLDALRALAMLLGIVLHATLPYFARIADIELMWPADDDQSLALLVLFDFIHLWRMPVFFLLAGFFAHLVLARRSTGAFIRDRLRRIAVPLVLFTGVMTLILPVLWNYGWKGEFAVDSGVLDPRKWPQYAAQGMPLAHLWFLWHLLVMYAVLLGLRHAGATRLGLAVRTVPPVASLARRSVAAVYARAPLALMAAAALLLAWRGGDESKPIFPPNVPDLLYGALFFFYGYGLWTRRASIRNLTHHGVLAVLWASAFAVYALHLAMLGALQVADGAGSSGVAATLALVEVLAQGCAVVLLTLALVGSCEALLRAPRPWVRWTADASYWIYLMHLPVVAWLTFWLAHLDRSGRLTALTGFAWGAGLKFLAAGVVTTAVGLATYRYLVRYTPLGTLLNGKRSRRH
ncbi:MAG: acyltransferase family protein [Spirochaetaceae bacterium]|nr:acyltransferase family protein [Spirochaetaceae bacterium]